MYNLNMITLSVKELKDILNTVEDDSLPVTIFDSRGDVFPVFSVDTHYIDRVELNTNTIPIEGELDTDS